MKLLASIKLASIFKKIKPIYIILGLFIVVLIVSGLGSKTKEGFGDSGTFTELKNYRTQREGVLKDINNFVKAQGSRWGNGATFQTNLTKYIASYTSLKLKSFFKVKDANNDGIIVVRKNDNSFVRDNSTTDNSGNTLGSDNKMFYYDLNAQDKNQDGVIVSYKNTDQGNFHKDNTDNSGNLVTSQSLAYSPFILEYLKDADKVTSNLVDANKKLLTDQINLLTSTSDKTNINNSLASLLLITDKIVKLMAEGNYDTSNYEFEYDPFNFEPYHKDYDSEWYKEYISKRYDDIYGDRYGDIYSDRDDDRYGYRYRDRDNHRSRHRYDEDDDADTSWDTENDTNGYDHRRRRQETSIDDNASSGTNYWKNLYLNSLNSMSSEQTPTYGSLLNGNRPSMTTTSNYDVSMGPRTYSSELLGTGASSSSRASAGATGSTTGSSSTNSSSTTSATGSNKSSEPVQQTKATSESYLLNNQNALSSTASSCPVAGGTAGSSPNNCRPAPVPPCPPCERCPEPSFDCKRVPRYNNDSAKYLPKPVLASFSQFGM